jgi:zinc protease
MTLRAAISLSLLAASSLYAAAESPPATPLHKLWKDVPSTELRAFKARAPQRFELENGIVLFLLEDHELPLIDLNLTVRGGELFEPPEATGLAQAVTSVMRSGGSATYPGDKLDELLEDMAASISFGMALDSASGGLSTLKEDFAKGLAIFVDVLRSPAFPDEKLDLYLAQARTAVAKRNDSPASIAHREFRRALYGEKSPYARIPEYATLNEIDRKALQSYHAAWFHPNHFIIGVTGAFKTADMLEQLKKALGDWPAQKSKTPSLPSISTSKKQKTLYCERPKINQTTVLMGHILDMRRDSKDFPAMQLLNEILSGSMSARMFTEIRTRKGLAYSVGGYAAVNYDRPGVFTCQAQTRNEQALDTVAALKEELLKLRERGVTAKELAESRESILNSFVFNFDTPAKIVKRQMTYEFYGYPLDFAERQLEAVRTATVEDVNKVAKKYLDPEKCVLLAVGGSAGDDPAKSFSSLKNVQTLDVTIPLPQAQPMVIDPDRESEGKRILAKCLKAAGGVENFKKVRTIRADVLLGVKAMGRELELRGCMRAEMPGSVRVDVEGPFGPISQVMTKDSAWKATGTSVQALKPQEARRNLRTLIQSDLGLMCMLAHGEEGYNVQALDPLRDGERELIGVELESQSLGRIKIWFDAQTKLLARLRYASDGVQREYDKLFSEHTRFGPLLLAGNIADKDPAGPQSIRMLNVEINPQLDPKLLDKPERALSPPKE